MKLLRRNLTEVEYREYLGKEEILVDGKHTGRYKPKYGDPEIIKGNMDLPNGFVQNQFFGINPDYTNILLVAKGPANRFDETGIIEWHGNRYQIMSIRESLNVIALALQKLTKGADEE